MTTNAPNDFAPATAGQLKHIASKAKDELDYSLNDGAGTAVAARVASFLNTNNYAAINLGQIKHVAQPFYERINAQGIVTGYPWTVATTTDDMNFAAANLGQLKTVFSFDFDADGDGMSDWWEMQHWTNTMHTGGDDGDNDGLLDVEEYVNRTDPNHNDSDGDGIPDGWEADNGLNPTNAADAEQDADGDTLSNLTEYQIGTDPNAVNTVQSVGDGEVLLETRSVASKRSLPKEGVAGFLNQDTYYRDIRLQADVNWDALYCETVPTTADVGVVTLRVDSHFMTETNCASIWSASGQLSGSNTVTVSDANTAVLSKSIDYTWATNIGEWVSLSRALWQTAAVGPGELIACTTEMNMPVCTTTNVTGTPPTVLFDERGPTNSLEDSHAQWKWEGAYGPGCTGVVISNSIPHGSVGSIDVRLTTPITISTLIDEVRADVTNADYWANLDWAAGYVEPRWVHSCPDEALGCTNADLIAALYQYSTEAAAKKGEYRLSVPNSISGVVYRAMVLKQRMSDGQILDVKSFCINSSGGPVYLTPTNGVPVDPPDSVDCIRIIVLKVEFDNVWDRNLNSLQSDNFPDYEKCIAIEWDSAGEVDLDAYLKIEPPGLTFADVDDVVSLEIETQIFGSGSINGSVLDYANTDPGDTDIYAFAVRLLRGGNVVDRLIVVIYASDTEDEYGGTGGWVANNPVNPDWLAELPAVCSSLGTGNSDPEPGAPAQWGGVNALGNNYHYSAAFQMRSVETAGGHGHQTCYDANGNLIEDDGVSDQVEERRASCGTADAQHWTDILWPPTHFSDDVEPFIRAAQLDGNPVDGVAALNNPLIRWGTNLQAYIARRPPHTADKVP